MSWSKTAKHRLTRYRTFICLTLYHHIYLWIQSLYLLGEFPFNYAHSRATNHYMWEPDGILTPNGQIHLTQLYRVATPPYYTSNAFFSPLLGDDCILLLSIKYQRLSAWVTTVSFRLVRHSHPMTLSHCQFIDILIDWSLTWENPYHLSVFLVFCLFH